uniref:Uncharacterized protein n=1 Tax=Scophthalmus maximus TaxID=52904 RepID=A0A8D3E158_SCOMX
MHICSESVLFRSEGRLQPRWVSCRVSAATWFHSWLHHFRSEERNLGKEDANYLKAQLCRSAGGKGREADYGLACRRVCWNGDGANTGISDLGSPPLSPPCMHGYLCMHPHAYTHTHTLSYPHTHTALKLYSR